MFAKGTPVCVCVCWETKETTRHTQNKTKPTQICVKKKYWNYSQLTSQKPEGNCDYSQTDNCGHFTQS